MIEYNEECLLKLLCLFRGSVGPRACFFAVPSAVITWFLVSADDFIPGWKESVGLFDDLKQVSVLWAASTAVLAILLGFRTNRAMARFWEGTGLLHQMRGEWFDSVSCCVTFSRAARHEKPLEVNEFRHTIVRLMSLCHGSALEEISFSDAEDLETIDSLGLDDRTLRHLKDCKRNYDFNRVEVLLHLIQSLITDNLDRGVLKVAPPILSRVYQTLSRGFVNFLNAKKIADTRFPFPYAQTIAILSLLQTVLTPLMVASIVSNQILAPIFAFVPIFGMFSLNFIGVELENPFGDDANDLPLHHFQTEMNRCLMMLLQDDADLMPKCHETRCIWDFAKLFASVHHRSESKAGQAVLQPARSHCRISEIFLDEPESPVAFHDREVSPGGLPNRSLSEQSIVFSEDPDSAAAVPDAVPLAVPALALLSPAVMQELTSASGDSEQRGGPHARCSEQVRQATGDAAPNLVTRCTSPEAPQAGPSSAAVPTVGEGSEAALPPGASPSWVGGADASECLDFICIEEAMRQASGGDRSIEESVERFSAALQELRDLVDDKLLQEFGRTSSALRSFSDALPGLLPASVQSASKLSDASTGQGFTLAAGRTSHTSVASRPTGSSSSGLSRRPLGSSRSQGTTVDTRRHLGSSRSQGTTVDTRPSPRRGKV